MLQHKWWICLKKQGLVQISNDNLGQKWKIKRIGLVPPTTTYQFPQRAEFYGGFAIASLLKSFYIWGGYKPLQLWTWINNEVVFSSNKLEHKQIGLKNSSQTTMISGKWQKILWKKQIVKSDGIGSKATKIEKKLMKIFLLTHSWMSKLTT